MTREEAIEFGNMWLEINEDYKDSNTYAVFQMAIQTLKQEPCNDCISRQYLLDNCVVDKVTMPYVPVNKIENAPPVTPQPKIGHWIVNEHGSIYCSECGCGALYDKVYPGESVFGKAIRVKSTFCPTCGAKMQEVEE